MTSSLVPFLLGLLVTAGLLIPLLLRFRGRTTDSDAHLATLEGELAALRKSLAEAEESQRGLAQFLKELPLAARDLFGGLSERQVPAALLRLVQRSLDPAQAAVLIRRADEQSARLVVMAASPETPSLRVGAELPDGRGETGFVAESQLVMARSDFTEKPIQERIKPGGASLGFKPELYAPIVFDQDTLGVIALSAPRRAAFDPKAALRLIAQTGAQALRAAAVYSGASAHLDGLTGSYNRRHLEQSLSELVYRAACTAYDRRSSAGAVSIVLLDVDHFKRYNEVNGPSAGDQLLQEIAKTVQATLRPEDVFGRFGGEEFLLILPSTGAQEALAAADKVRAAIATGALTVSAGVAEYPSDGADAAALLRAADEALQEAKRQGRNRAAGRTPR